MKVCVVAGTGDVWWTQDPVGKDWHATTLVSSANAYFQTLTCPTATNCLVTDNNGYAYTTSDVTAGHWTRTLLTQNLQNSDSAACPTTTACIVTSGSLEFTSTNAFTPTPTWTESAISTGGGQWQIACSSLTQCFIGGYMGGFYSDPAPVTQPIAGWSDAASSATLLNDVGALSCPSTQFCATSTDSYFGYVINPVSVSSTWVDIRPTSWPGQAKANDLGFHSISCPTESWCMMGEDGSGGGGLDIASLPKSSPPVLVHLAMHWQGNVNGVSCPTTSLCVAADASGDVHVGTR